MHFKSFTHFSLKRKLATVIRRRYSYFTGKITTQFAPFFPHTQNAHHSHADDSRVTRILFVQVWFMTQSIYNTDILHDDLNYDIKIDLYGRGGGKRVNISDYSQILIQYETMPWKYTWMRIVIPTKTVNVRTGIRSVRVIWSKPMKSRFAWHDENSRWVAHRKRLTTENHRIGAVSTPIRRMAVQGKALSFRWETAEYAHRFSRGEIADCKNKSNRFSIQVAPRGKQRCLC